MRLRAGTTPRLRSRTSIVPAYRGSRWTFAPPPVAAPLLLRGTLELTIVFEDGEDGFVIASIPDIPGTHSQGRTREEAKANVLDALEVMLTPRRALRRAGWEIVRTRGDHEQWRSPDGRSMVTVAGQDNKDVPAGTLRSIRQSTGLEDLR